MKSKNLIKIILTSIPLIILLVLSFINSNILIISLILVSVISFLEFQGIISKIYTKKSFKISFNKLFLNGIFLIYLILFSIILFLGISDDNLKIFVIFLFLICICSDIGGLLFGKIFKGKKLTRISPNKTISGSIGSFILSLALAIIYYLFLNNYFSNLLILILITFLISLICQLGDLFISYLKRKAKVKDSGTILPGHGGLLDRIDGMLFALPSGIIIFELLTDFL